MAHPSRVKDCYSVTSPRVTCHVSRAVTTRLLWPEDFSCHKKLFIIELVTRAFLRTCVSGSGDYQILKRFVFRMCVWHLSSFGRGKYQHYLYSVLVVAFLKHPFNNSISFVICFFGNVAKSDFLNPSICRNWDLLTLLNCHFNFGKNSFWFFLFPYIPMNIEIDALLTLKKLIIMHTFKILSLKVRATCDNWALQHKTQDCVQESFIEASGFRSNIKLFQMSYKELFKQFHET